MTGWKKTVSRILISITALSSPQSLLLTSPDPLAPRACPTRLTLARSAAACPRRAAPRSPRLRGRDSGAGRRRARRAPAPQRRRPRPRRRASAVVDAAAPVRRGPRPTLAQLQPHRAARDQHRVRVLARAASSGCATRSRCGRRGAGQLDADRARRGAAQPHQRHRPAAPDVARVGRPRARRERQLPRPVPVLLVDLAGRLEPVARTVALQRRGADPGDRGGHPPRLGSRRCGPTPTRAPSEVARRTPGC